MKTIKIWIFCDVIDNYGDIGFALRLARSLQKECNFTVYLWINNLKKANQLNNKIDKNLNIQFVEGIFIIKWDNKILKLYLNNNLKEITEADCVIELFGCNIPIESILKNRNQNLLWLNLEYLSAEAWTKEWHLMPSIQPSGIEKYFYFMGFDNNSGGILKEHDYLKNHFNFINHKNLIDTFIKRYDLEYQSGQFIVFVFAYPSSVWISLIQMLSQVKQNVILWIAEEGIYEETQFFLQKSFQIKKKSKNVFTLKQMTIQKLPFIQQNDFDKLLWLSDFSIVRGEDSFIRAQLAGKPFIWNIYPQKESIHLHKLSAFWDKFCLETHLAKNNGLFVISDIINLNKPKDDKNLMIYFKDVLKQYQNITVFFQKWNMFLIKQQSVVEKLAIFIQKRLKL